MAKDTGFFAEFKKFIARGNVMDMAVGVIIGGAFGKISTSLVNDIIMPAVCINYGTFLSTILDFLIIAFAVFCLIRFLNNLHRKKEEAPAAPPAPPEPSAEEKLLTEIRDLLKDRK